MKAIQYMGSKTNLVCNIELAMRDFFGDSYDNQKTFFDAFSGSGTVANYFKNKFDVITNDKQSFTKVINEANLKNRFDKQHFESLINELNALPSEYFNKTDGWFTKTYAQEFNNGSSICDDGVRKIFLTKNGKKVDMIRFRIDEMFENGIINNNEKNVLLMSLISAVDKITNTLGHQNGYLKEWSKKSLKDLVLIVPDLTISNKNHKNFTGDIDKISPHVKADIMYIDPPYGKSNGGTGTRYSSFYHLHNTIVENSRPEIFGKASKPVATRVSDRYESTKKIEVMKLMINLLKRSQCEHFVISYSTSGLLSVQDFEKVFELAGCNLDSLKLYKMNHTLNSQSTSAAKKLTQMQLEGSVTELLFIISKSNGYLCDESEIQLTLNLYLQQKGKFESCLKNIFIIDNGIISEMRGATENE
ncbi:DNA adenine methylase [Vibrio harveyi]|uniref:DNA adenine methylase n=1 Tax=Vibrio harveyi TaxID=669 RepID=UPI00234C681A|nr:DNA adenine methylase [Vibrio harveyi]WCP83241.1 DNA adenine methylase [Vibrio harveyi]